MHEDEGSVSVAVSVLTGTLGRDIIVSLKTMNGTAVGKSPQLLQEFYIHIENFHLILQCSWDGLSPYITQPDIQFLLNNTNCDGAHSERCSNRKCVGIVHPCFDVN